MSVRSLRPRKKKPRFRQWVCKPCWELKYCPYGPLVEFYPLHPEEQSLRSITEVHQHALSELEAGGKRSDVQWLRLIELYLYSHPPTWKWIKKYQTKELGCSVFGHVCPVFLEAEPFTETKVGRRTGRTIPRDVMLKVVRRDGQICQRCHEPVKDTEVEFDHLIPVSKGGPMTVENLRLTCRPCNRKKRDSLAEVLDRA